MNIFKNKLSPIDWICLFVFSTNLMLSRGEKCGGVTEEGNEHTLTCTLQRSPFSPGIVWELQTRAGYEKISSCEFRGSCTDLRPASFQASRRIVPERTGVESHMGLLKIVSTNKTQNRFRCLRDAGPETCDLQVYVKSQVPICQSPSLTQIGTITYLNITCSSEKVYPQGGCNFTYKGLPSTLSVDVTAWNVWSSTSPGNYKTVCLWLAPISGLDPSNIQVQAEVYPHLSSWVEAASAYSEWTLPLVLNLPRVILADDCPAGPSVRRGYILVDTLATCKCQLKMAGYTQGFAQWYKNGSKIGTNEEDGSAVLTIQYNNKGTTFICQPESALQQSNPQNISYSPKFAVGPSTLKIDMSDANPLCPTESFMYQVTCRVPSDNVVPLPLFTIIINNKTAYENKTGKLDISSNDYSLTHTFRPEFGGTHRVYCRVTNEVFSDLFYQHERPYIINEPPSQAPVLIAYDSQPSPGNSIAYVTDGSNVQLTCTVDGGYPQVSNVTIVCGSNWNTMQGTLATISVRITNGIKTLICHCSAWHVTGCYHNRTVLVLSLKKPENINKEDSQQSDTSLSLGLGIGFGGTFILLIVMVIVFIIFNKKKSVYVREKEKSQDMPYSKPDFTSASSYQYAHFVPGRGALPLPLIPSEQCQSDYDLITLDTDKAPGSSADRDSSTDINQDTIVPEDYIQPI